MAELATVELVHPKTGRIVVVNQTDETEWRGRGYVSSSEASAPKDDDEAPAKKHGKK